MLFYETERLILRQWRDEDIVPFAAMNADPLVMEFFPQLRTREESQQALQKIQAHFVEYGYGVYAITDKAHNFIGMVGLQVNPDKFSFSPCVEIMWRIVHRSWGNGYAPEAARKCLEIGLQEFNLPVIAEYADSLNDNPILIPREDAHAKMIVKRWEALADGIMDSAILVRTESMRLLEKQDPAVIIRYNEAVSRALAFAAQELTINEWCAGGQLSLADLALVSALIYVDLRQPEREWRKQHPNLAQLFERLSARESVKIAVTGG